MQQPFLIAALLLASLTGCLSDTLDSSYDTMQEAIERGAVHKGWIPTWIPADVTRLSEVHNLDSNASALAFDLPRGSTWQLDSSCREVAYADTVPSRFDRSWWPSDKTLATRYRFFRCRADAAEYAFVGIDPVASRGLHWRTWSR